MGLRQEVRLGPIHAQSMNLHPTVLTTTSPGDELGRQLMSLRYDLLTETLKGMVNEARRQCYNDNQLGRSKLSDRLSLVAVGLQSVVFNMEHVVRICSPYIDAEKDKTPMRFPTSYGTTTFRFTSFKLPL